MKYMGSKARIAKEILQIIQRGKEEYFVEPFCGGCNMTSSVDGLRIANDSNKYLIRMWIALRDGWQPAKINKEFYNNVKNNKELFDAHIVGWVGFNCSYSGKFFGGFAGETMTKIGKIRDYQQEAIDNVSKQIKNLKDVIFTNNNYFDLQIPENSVIYCDPPYEGTTGYKEDFDHVEFWNWVREQSKTKRVFISEYSAPDDFNCIWQKEVKSSLSANGKIGGNKNSIEKLFTLNV